MAPQRIVFVTSCYNEARNVKELYQRCHAVFEAIQKGYTNDNLLEFAMIYADNNSSDQTLSELKDIATRDANVQVLANQKNYGPEASFANALSMTRPNDIVIGITSDLQDPPEVAESMIKELLTNHQCDAVLAIKKQASSNLMLAISRQLYYSILGYSSRLNKVPSGFHGFGAYRFDVIAEALELWQNSGFNLRMCLVNGCQSPLRRVYQQANRQYGNSTYPWWGYPQEAIVAILAADSTASRFAFGLSTLGIISAAAISFLLLLNWLGGNSRYEPGLPTVMALILGSFAMQMLMIALLSRQVETLRMAGLRPKVRYQTICKSPKNY